MGTEHYYICPSVDWGLVETSTKPAIWVLSDLAFSDRSRMWEFAVTEPNVPQNDFFASVHSTANNVGMKPIWRTIENLQRVQECEWQRPREVLGKTLCTRLYHIDETYCGKHLLTGASFDGQLETMYHLNFWGSLTPVSLVHDGDPVGGCQFRRGFGRIDCSSYTSANLTACTATLLQSSRPNSVEV